MSQVAITRVNERGRESSSLIEQMKTLGDNIRQRAYELFQKRQGESGTDLDDWLKAEEELIWAPESELVDRNGQFQVQVAVPGFDPKDIFVAAYPDALTVRAEATHKHEEGEGEVYFCEFGSKTLFRKFDLPATIDVNKVTVRLEKGVLHLAAAKKETPSEKTSAKAA